MHPISGDGDFFHHLNTGRFILENHRLPYLDQWTFTASGKPWVGYAWGSGVIFYLIFSSFGPIGISIFIASVALCTFILLHLLLLSHSVPKKISLTVLLLSAAVLSIRWPSRPELWTYPFLILLLLIDKLKGNRPKSALLLPVIILLWANLYGSAVLIGLLIIILLTLKQLINDKFKILARQRLFYISCFTAFLASFFNGYGFKSLFYIPSIAKYEGEWLGIFETLNKAPLEYLRIFQLDLNVYLLFLAVFLIVLFLSFKKLTSYFFLLILSLSLLIPFKSVRLIPLATILSLPLLACLTANLSKPKRKIVIYLCLITSIISISLSLWSSPIGLAKEDLAVKQLINFIKTNNLSGRAFNNQQIGGLLTYYLYPEVLVFSDTRDDLFLGTHVFEDMRNLPTNVLLNKYNVDLIIVDRSEEQKLKLLFKSSNWSLIFLNGRFLVAIPGSKYRP